MKSFLMILWVTLLNMLATIVQFFQDHFSQFLIVAISVFGGAFFAFRLEKKHRDSQERLRNCRLLKQAQFILILQYECMAKWKTHWMGDFQENDDTKWQKLNAYIGVPSIPEVDIESILFLLDDRADLLHKIKSVSDGFTTGLETIRTRNQAVEEWHLMPDREDMLHAQAGITRKLKDMTAALYENTELWIENNQQIGEELKQHIAKKHPGEAWLEYAPRPAATSTSEAGETL